MARKVTSLYAETLVLLNLWALDKTPAPQSKFISAKEQEYKTALKQLTEEGSLTEVPKGKRYSITENGKLKLSESLGNKGFSFSSNAGPKTTNALLKWFRQNSVSHSTASPAMSPASNGHSKNGSTSTQISSYKDFTKTALDTYDQLNRDYNLDDLVPIYRIRRELGDRLSRQHFNEWLLETQGNDLIQLMGGDLPNVTPDQLEDSVAIPGGGTRFYVKRL